MYIKFFKPTIYIIHNITLILHLVHIIIVTQQVHISISTSQIIHITMLTTHINTIHGTHYNTCINTIHGTHYNINTIHGTHCTINTTHSTSTFKNNHLCEQKLLPLLKITYYIGVQVDLSIMIKRRWKNHIHV